MLIKKYVLCATVLTLLLLNPSAHATKWWDVLIKHAVKQTAELEGMTQQNNQQLQQLLKLATSGELNNDLLNQLKAANIKHINGVVEGTYNYRRWSSSEKAANDLWNETYTQPVNGIEKTPEHLNAQLDHQEEVLYRRMREAFDTNDIVDRIKSLDDMKAELLNLNQSAGIEGVVEVSRITNGLLGVVIDQLIILNDLVAANANVRLTELSREQLARIHNLTIEKAAKEKQSEINGRAEKELIKTWAEKQ